MCQIIQFDAGLVKNRQQAEVARWSAYNLVRPRANGAALLSRFFVSRPQRRSARTSIRHSPAGLHRQTPLLPRLEGPMALSATTPQGCNANKPQAKGTPAGAKGTTLAEVATGSFTVPD